MANEPSPTTSGLRGIDIRARTDGLTLCVEQVHRFHNDSGADVEIIYSFPLPTDAAILSFTATVANRTVGSALSGDDADRYEATVEAGGLAAELERREAGLCTLSIGRLGRGERAVATTVWARFLEVSDGHGRAVVPASASAPEGSRLTGPLGPASASLLADYDLSFDLILQGPAATANVTSPSHPLSHGWRGRDAFVGLSERAHLDRDVVIRLDGLPEADGVLAGPWRGHVAVVRAPQDVARQTLPLDIEVWIDAAGPLGPHIRDAAVFLKSLEAKLEEGDRIAVWKVGRTAAAVVERGARPVRALDESALRSLAADLGDLPTDTSAPPLPMPKIAELLLITDGRTRLSEAVCREARETGKRLFILGAGAAPSEALLRPAALVSGGDYVAVAPFEPLEPAVSRLSARFARPPPRREAPCWQGAAWSRVLPAEDAGLGNLAIAGFVDPPASEALFDGKNGALRRLDPRSDRLALPMMMLALERGARGKLDPEIEAWAERLRVPSGTRWTAVLGRGGDTPPQDPPHLVISQQMVTAGERGLGRLSPTPSSVELRDDADAGPLGGEKAGRPSKAKRASVTIPLAVFAMAVVVMTNVLIATNRPAGSSLQAGPTDRPHHARRGSAAPAATAGKRQGRSETLSGPLRWPSRRPAASALVLGHPYRGGQSNRWAALRGCLAAPSPLSDRGETQSQGVIETRIYTKPLAHSDRFP